MLGAVTRNAHVQRTIFCKASNKYRLPNRPPETFATYPGVGIQLPKVSNRIAQKNQLHRGQSGTVLQCDANGFLAQLPILDTPKWRFRHESAISGCKDTPSRKDQ